MRFIDKNFEMHCVPVNCMTQSIFTKPRIPTIHRS